MKERNYIFLAAFVYFAFFSLIGLATYFTNSAWCLWALLLTPNLKLKGDD